MGVPEFYLNALPDYRRDAFEFLLSLYNYLREKAGTVHQPQSALPPKYHHGLSRDIGEAVYLFVQKLEFPGEMNRIVEVLKNEQSTEIPSVRDHVLKLANESLLAQNPNVFLRVDMGYRDFLLHFVDRYTDSLTEARNMKKGLQDKMKNSVVSPAMNHIRQLVEFYGLHLHKKDSESYLTFYACVCAFLLRLDCLKLGDFTFPVLGEAENVLHRYRNNFPGYFALDNCVKVKKQSLILAGRVRVPQINE